MTKTFTDSVNKTLRADVQAEAREFAKQYLSAELFRVEMEEKNLLPSMARSQILLIENGNVEHLTAEQLEAQAAQLSKLRRIVENPSVQAEARRSVVGRFLGLRQVMDSLAAAVAASFKSQIDTFEQAERDFFSKYGVPHEQTGLTRTAISMSAAFALKIDQFHAACRFVSEQPTGQSIPEVNFADFAFLFEPAAK